MKETESYFAKNLAVVMEEAGVSSESLAKALGVTAQNINNWLSGKYSPRPAVLKALADHFGHTVTDFKYSDIEKAKEDNTYVEINVGDDIKIIKARTGVILAALSELLSQKSGRLGALELSDLERMVNDLLGADERE